ncbi:1-phosphatidylinositol phosphodiesterase [Kibdelosporangium banguiense]|uniref:1-phosphatidylinositol phosphodiesterase n=1 Tax=Kibdelosporangium banguiense TaxID=1365924 RepID=A0ABS4TQV6_9PSEU|nr:ricin-type beta-trefoil lectin domain protein [Kibdelosporangium banguiense]MBP2326788.1 1-phosphatidylinositol phosphodiesterase [Kibdelosporangium banguiense]
MSATMSLAIVSLAGTASAHETSSYSHDARAGAYPRDWMAYLPGTTTLSELSLPGTHDTGAYRVGGDSVFTQSMDLGEQLNAGIRAWDIRLGPDPIDNRLKVYHGPAPQLLDFENDVLVTATNYLKMHPNESLVMRIKQNHGPSEGFDTQVKAGLDKYPLQVYQGTGDNPTVREIRGKIVVLQDFGSAVRMGIPWNSLAKQDEYNVNDNWDLANKWHAVRNHLNAAQSGPRDVTYVNFLSASGGSFPYFIASGHVGPATDASRLVTGWVREGPFDTCHLSSKCISEYPSVDCLEVLGQKMGCTVVFEGVNIMTHNEINRRGWPNRYGMIMMDFPGSRLIETIIDTNDFRSMLKVKESGRCLDVPSATPRNSIIVTVFDCHGGPNQQWSRTPFGQLVVYGTYCLDVRNGETKDSTPVQIYGCNGTGAQKWELRPDGLIVNPASGKCLDSTNGSGNGAQLVIYPCHGNTNQRWSRL